MLPHSASHAFCFAKDGFEKDVLLRENKTEMSLVMGTFLSLHCEP